MSDETGSPLRSPEVAKVDYLIDENGASIELQDEEGLRVTHDVNAPVGGTEPSNTWRYALIGLAIVAVVLIIMQLVSSQPG